MKLHIKDKYDIKVVNDIKLELLKLIKEKKIEGKLPNISELAKENEIKSVFIKKAYQELINDGFLIKIYDKGYFVDNIVNRKYLQEVEKTLKTNEEDYF